VAKNRQLSRIEEFQIRKKLVYVLTDKNFTLLKNASIVSLFTALIPVFAFYFSVDKTRIFGWLAGMTIAHLACIALVAYYHHCHPSLEKIAPWKNIVRLGVFISTLAWGSMGVLLIPDTAVSQNFVLFFLIIISSSAALGTSVDYLSSSIGILCSLVPYICWQLHEGMMHPGSMHFYAGIILISYLLFLHIISFVSYQMMKKSVELSFRNVTLASKLTEANVQLKDLNNELEDRVFHRTQELNHALSTVTYQATHDLVTSLPNQIWLLQYVSEIIMKDPNQQFAIACLSINNMENISDRYGYYANDTVIKEASERLVEILKNKTQSGHYQIAIARRDVFVILIEKIYYENMDQIINNIFVAFEKPIEILHENIFEKEQIFCSLGFSIYPKDAVIADQLLIKADTAMFYTKKQFENNYEHRYEHYNREITENIQYKVQLRKNIQTAISRDEFYLCYQPLVDIKTGLIASTEALLRWVHPVTGVSVPPSEIIKVAEDYNLIIPLGEWVLRKACTQNYLWYKLGFKNIVSVNLSAKQLERGNIVKTVSQI
jgi:diguanylate cyclase (GGDEF)-like protein